LDIRDKQIQDLVNMNLKLMGRISLLEARIVDLESQLARYQNPKNSGNSSIPPSKDENRPKKTQSLREDSERKPGGQPGHTGHTLEMNANPDVITDHIPGFCSCCGHDLSGISAELSSKRQVIDLPIIKPVCTEHRSYHKTCLCGEKNKAAYPEHVNAPVQYGSGVETIVGYLHARQYLPYNRLKELLKDCYGIPLSEGSIDNIIRRFALKAAPIYQKLKKAVADSPVIGCDETGAKVDGNKHWVWTYQTEKLTVLAMSEYRGLKATTAHFQDGFGKAILCHDAWRTYFHYSQNLHQLCCAHLLRELNYIVERYKSKWAEQLRSLFREAISLKKKLPEFPCQEAEKNIAAIEDQMDRLLGIPVNPAHKEAVTFQRRLLKYRDSILTFLHYHKVPPDNNGSERAVRNIKVKQKISGQFKSTQGADDFCVIRSIVDTLIKQSENVLQNLTHISKLVPE
jgi:transposase